MSTPTLLLYIALACFCISVFAEKGTRGKRISSAFRRASELSFVFFYGMIAMRLESVWLCIVGVCLLCVMPPAASGMACSAGASDVSSAMCFGAIPRRTLRGNPETSSGLFALWAGAMLSKRFLAWITTEKPEVVR